MRAALALLFLTCATATGGPVELRTISRGNNAAAKPSQPQAIAVTNEADYRRQWPSVIGAGEAPAVDFAKESVVFLLAGSKPTGGWSVEARGVTVEGETLVVDAAIHAPPPGAIVTQAFTSPYAVIAVSTKLFKDVRWTP
ncbi:MAG TPA: protease complex subunit PrcB family protein [Thermoanaerobaculia bacterium]|nr:protease complex subunit PrcB family protein [Thermoanaerobaculia bacterium]